MGGASQDQPRYKHLRRTVSVVYLGPFLHDPKRAKGALECCDCCDKVVGCVCMGDRLLLFRNWSAVEAERGDAGSMNEGGKSATKRLSQAVMDLREEEREMLCSLAAADGVQTPSRSSPHLQSDGSRAPLGRCFCSASFRAYILR